MRFTHLSFTALLFALLTACGSPPVSNGTPEFEPQTGTTIGEAMEGDSIVQFSVVDATPPEFFNKTLLVEAEVVNVCAKAGCWMQIKDGESTALVRWETGCGGKYKFPMESVGKRIVIQGSFYPKDLTEEDRDHMQGEAKTPLEIREHPYEFNASAVRILDAE